MLFVMWCFGYEILKFGFWMCNKLLFGSEIDVYGFIDEMIIGEYYFLD